MKNKNMITVKLVDDTFGANYLDREIHFKIEDILWYQTGHGRKNSEYPETVMFCFKGSDVVFRARREDFFEAIGSEQ